MRRNGEASASYALVILQKIKRPHSVRNRGADRRWDLTFEEWVPRPEVRMPCTLRWGCFVSVNIIARTPHTHESIGYGDSHASPPFFRKLYVVFRSLVNQEFGKTTNFPPLAFDCNTKVQPNVILDMAKKEKLFLTTCGSQSLPVDGVSFVNCIYFF